MADPVPLVIRFNRPREQYQENTSLYDGRGNVVASGGRKNELIAIGHDICDRERRPGILVESTRSEPGVFKRFVVHKPYWTEMWWKDLVDGGGSFGLGGGLGL